MKISAILTDRHGNTLITAIVFLGIFLTLTTALLSYVQLEIATSTRSIADSQAFGAAEAGIEYYRWHLAHDPNDTKDGTGNTGPYRHPYRDPQGGEIGSFTLTIGARNPCDGSIRIVSEGRSATRQERKRTIAITYGAPALTKYSFLTNANIWFGGNDELKGPVHANGGIRMDAKNQNRMTSAKATYICGKEHSCNPPQTKPGVWGAGDGGTKGLWDFPTTAIDFGTIALDLRILQENARAANTSFAPSGALGYHARLKTDGTVDVFRVTATKPNVWGYDGRTGWVETTEGIATETLVRTVTLPETNACGKANLLFFDDTLWVEGETKGPVTLVAGRTAAAAPPATIIINGNLTTPSQGAEGKQGAIGLVANGDILIPLESPNALAIHAALFAQQGHVFRNYYCADEKLNRYGYKCKASYGPFVLRDSLTMKGTVVTNQIAAWTWVNGSGQVISGYRGGESTYETRLIFSPPPFFPAQGEQRILTWEEVQ